MIGLLQRVTEAAVHVDGTCVGRIGPGLVVLIGIERRDTRTQAERLLERLLGYRVFDNAEGRMEHSLRETAGALMLVPQFTLVADTRKGTRASFTPAATPQSGSALFGYLLHRARSEHGAVAAGRFGAHMQVSLINDGPVTFWLQVPPAV
ncbi:D-aminoacyl-tRNA deacylase [Nitrococcus mobilis]|uniref:D-aminoacyl-tRNA deacylase n=1 Tax=Nitrococcus mobilis Nb-231 TaxID=314278 RepID=A4BP74_9GAMM|nr:D-aminoacyl-tRNA deacylase [Nitrococcus mobilis]EAR22375.1 D-tyrosyl-tRNA(Tyr) deacylase [Nitrococcus mobilis Nb-231]